MTEIKSDNPFLLIEETEEQETQKPNEFAQLLEESFKKKRKKLSVGERIRGEILVLGKEDVFVSTGVSGVGSDGILPRRELEEISKKDGQANYRVGDVIDVYVIQIRGSEIRLSVKPSAQSISNDLEDAFDMMLPVEGRVVEVCKGGVRVNIHGKMAFCPISQLDYARVETGEEFVGKKLEFRITQFSEGGRNIVVSRRKILDDQRDQMQGAFLEEHQVGEMVTGQVKRLETFGAFVELAPGIEGLVHISELSWSRVAHPKDVLTVGEEVRVKILKKESVEGRLRISLSLRDAGVDPWTMLSQKFPVGTAITGKVERREPYGLFIHLQDGITGLLPKSKALEQPQFHYEKVKVGDSITVQVAEIKPQERRVTLSLPRDPNQDDWKDFMPQGSSGSAGGSLGTLGDLFKKSMEKKKS